VSRRKQGLSTSKDNGKKHLNASYSRIVSENEAVPILKDNCLTGLSFPDTILIKEAASLVLRQPHFLLKLWGDFFAKGRFFYETPDHQFSGTSLKD